MNTVVAPSPPALASHWRALTRILSWCGTLALVAWVAYRSWFICLQGITSPGSVGNDFAIFRQSAWLMLRGENPYVLPSGVNPNLNHPLITLWAVPFALLAPHQGFLLWDVLALISWVLALAVTVRIAGVPRHIWLRPVPIALALTYTGFISAVQLGQISPFLTLLVVAGWCLARRGQQTWACLLFGALIALKLAVLPLAAFALVGGKWRNWRGPVALIGGALGVSLLPLPVVGFAGYRSWLAYLGTVDYGQLFITNMSLVGWWFHLRPGAPPVLAQLSTALGCVAALAVVQIRAPRAWRSTDWYIGALLLIGLLTSPIAWDHYLPLLLPFFGGTAAAWPRISRPARWLSVGGLLAVLGYLEIRFLIWTIVGFPPRMGSILCVGLLLLLGALFCTQENHVSTNRSTR